MYYEVVRPACFDSPTSNASQAMSLLMVVCVRIVPLSSAGPSQIWRRVKSLIFLENALVAERETGAEEE